MHSARVRADDQGVDLALQIGQKPPLDRLHEHNCDLAFVVIACSSDAP